MNAEIEEIRLEFSLSKEDCKEIENILRSSGFFYDYEIDVAIEIAEDYLNKADHNGYYYIAVKNNNTLIGFSCYGLIPCTKNSYDLYWIAIHNDFRGKGLGRRLLKETESQIKKIGGNNVYIETSSTDKYASTQTFYLGGGYIIEARLKNYYREGDDKLIYSKNLN